MKKKRDKRFKLTDAQVLDIRQSIIDGCDELTLANKYSVSQGTISRIKTGQVYWHVPNLITDKYVNFWSYFAPKYRRQIIRLYEDGMNQEEIAAWLTRINERGTKISQSHVHHVLTKAGIYHQEKRNALYYQIKQFRKDGLKYREISKLLKLSSCTIWKYIKRFKPKKTLKCKFKK